MYLEISNKGIADPLAFVLMGGSTKRGDNKTIGMFGSGNKFAPACLIRENVKFRIFMGTEELSIATIKVTLGDVEFERIVIDGNETSLTTAMGKDWKVWQAIREFYANALDEGEAIFDYAEEINPTENRTTIYLELTDEVEEVIQNKEKYFSVTRTPLEVTPIGKIYRNEGTGIRVYRRGIRCYEGTEKSMFDYDFDDIDINESRMLEYSWDLHTKVWKTLFACKQQQIIRKLITQIGSEEFYETKSISSGWVETYHARELSSGWETLLNEKYLVTPVMAEMAEPEEIKKSIIVPPKLHQILEVHYADKKTEVSPPSFIKSNRGTNYKHIPTYTPLQLDVLMKAKSFFIEAKYTIPYEIKIVVFINPNILGSIEKEANIILVSEKSIALGVHDTINTILEEYIHLKHEVLDETRAFQTAAIDELVNYMKLRTGVIV